MSDQNEKSAAEPVTRRRRDAGFTLPELLVTIIVLGSIVAVLSSAIIVTFQQKDNTEGRLNVTRAEQNVGMWIPADLASTGTVPSTAANLSPCSATLADTSTCPSNVTLTGSNASVPQLDRPGVDPRRGIGDGDDECLVSLHTAERRNVRLDADRVRRSVDGGAWTCEVFAVLTKLPGPPDGAFEPGVTVPSWVLLVSVPLAPDSIGPEPDPTYVNNKNANRVIVTINGGGAGAPAPAAARTASASPPAARLAPRSRPTASSTHRRSPRQRSRCGGPIAADRRRLGLDRLGNMGLVTNGVKKFVETFAGTPTQIQIVRFDNTSGVIGAGSDWTKYYDMGPRETQVKASCSAC